MRGQNFEGMCLYDKVRRNIIVPTSTLNMWHCVGSVHRYPSTRIYCVTKHKPNTLSITLCQMGIRTPPAYLHTNVLSSKALLRTLMLLRGSIGEMWPKPFLHRIIATLWEAALSMSVPAWKSHLCGSTSRLDRWLFLRLPWICHIFCACLVNGEITSPYEMYVIFVHFSHTLIRRRDICKKIPEIKFHGNPSDLTPAVTRKMSDMTKLTVAFPKNTSTLGTSPQVYVFTGVLYGSQYKPRLFP